MTKKNESNFMKNGECGFCYSREQGTHGQVICEWSAEWQMYIPACNKHSFNPEDRARAVEMGRAA